MSGQLNNLSGPCHDTVRTLSGPGWTDRLSQICQDAVRTVLSRQICLDISYSGWTVSLSVGTIAFVWLQLAEPPVRTVTFVWLIYPNALFEHLTVGSWGFALEIIYTLQP